MGIALRLAKDMIDDKNETPSRIYRPAVVLVSDGVPTDSWKEPMDKFINDGRSAKCQRFAVAIGNDADRKLLERFTQNLDNVFFAEDAKDISEQFKIVSMSISTMASAPNLNNNPTLSTIPKYNDSTNNSDDDLY